MENLFIAFEGIDGCGKSTQLKMLRDYLQSLGETVVATKEPTEGKYGSKVRAAALSGTRLPLAQESALLIKDRKEHVGDLIKPSLGQGAWVLTDRYYYSMYAYQGASGEDADQLLRWNKQLFIRPDMTFLFCAISPSEAAKRIGSRGNGADAFENLEFQQKVSDQFGQLHNSPDLFYVIATDSIEKIHDEIKTAVVRFSQLKVKIKEGILSRAMARDVLQSWRDYPQLTADEMCHLLGYVPADNWHGRCVLMLTRENEDPVFWQTGGMTEAVNWTANVRQATKLDRYKAAAELDRIRMLWAADKKDPMHVSIIKYKEALELYGKRYR